MTRTHSIQFMLDKIKQRILFCCFQGPDPVNPGIGMFSMSLVSGFLCVVFSKHYPKIISADSAEPDPSGPPVLDALSTATSLAKDPDLRFQFLSEP